MKKIENYSVIPPSAQPEEIKILLVDDQSFALGFIGKLIETASHLKIVGTADNGQEAIALVESLQPDVVLLDLEMPEMDGVTATEIITNRFPQCKVLVLSSHETGDYLQNALRAGAKGYLIKGSPAKELTHAIDSVYQGYTQLSPGLLEKVLTPEVEILSPQEAEKQSTIEEELDWAESTRTTVNTLPRVSLRAILYICLILFSGIIPWAMLTQIDEIGTARGKLEPKGKVINLDAPVSGTVMNIAVEEGERVKANQPLMELDTKLISSQLQQQQQKLVGQQTQLNQLKLLKNQQALALRTQEQQNQAQKFEQDVLIDQARQNVKSLKATSSSQLAEKEAQLKQAQEAIKASAAAHQTAKIRYRSAQAKVPRYQKAYQQGALSQDLLLEAQQQVEEYRASVTQTAAELAQAEAVYQEQQNGYEKLRQQTEAEIEQALLRLTSQQRSLDSLAQTQNLAILKSQEESKNTETQITSMEAEIAQTQSLITGLEYQMQQLIFYAPTAGTVFQLSVKKPGAVVQVGQMVAQIAPQDSPLILRGKISSQESGFLKVGLPVKVKFDAYPFQDYGIVPGRLTWISPDSRINQISGSSNSLSSDNQLREFYEIEVTLKRNYIQNRENTITLTPGHTATAEIIIRQRRLADIFLAPFKSLQQGRVKL